MKKNKGFTLIELLTVIAILAVILLISAPTILGVLEKAKKNAFKNQALLYESGLKTQITLNEIGDSEIGDKLNWQKNAEGKDEVTISIEDLNNTIMDTNGLTSGEIKITKDNNDKYTYTFINIKNGEYKIVGEVESTDLNHDNIYKLSEIVSFGAYKIGDAVTLVNGSTWHVVYDSEDTEENVVLFADLAVTRDGKAWTNQATQTVSFDEYDARYNSNNTYCTQRFGCNIYAATNETVTNAGVSGTVTEDSSIKKFMDTTAKPFINNGLIKEIKEIRLITLEELENFGCDFTTATTCADAPAFLDNTRFWTMTPNKDNTSGVWAVVSRTSFNSNANSAYGFNARPVIVVSKKNIKEV